MLAAGLPIEVPGEHGQPLLRLGPAGGELRRDADHVRPGGPRHRRRRRVDEPRPDGLGRRRPGEGPASPALVGALSGPGAAGRLRGD